MNINQDIQPALCLSLDNLNWIYRGEGNANLVISLPQEKIILRMQKCEYDIIVNKRVIQQMELKIITDLKFYKFVMLPLLGKAFVQPPFLARISDKEIAELDAKLYNFRPSFRLNKGVRFSLLTGHPDYTHLPPSLTYEYFQSGLQCSNLLALHNECFTYCIEIKPKQGWIPLCDRNHPKCAFCCNQYLKYMKKRVRKISQYCPLDLFSGNISRMKKALKNLLKTPQNNLKIFENGNLIYSEDSLRDYVEILRAILEPGSEEVNSERLIEKWSALLQEALTKRLSDAPSYTFVQDGKENDTKDNSVGIPMSSPLEGMIPACDWNSEPLPENCVLQRILSIQKLQNTSFNSIYKSYCDKKDFEEDYAYVDNLLCVKKCWDPIQRYLLATTAKDCSIFITLQRCSNKNIDNNLHYVTDFDGISYRINIGISDLDSKPLSCIEKHYRRDSEILSAILFYANSKVM
ncbi:inositol-pentakisphosphate 2-kinase [Cimex lectularius]|uniref:Inositol-pentakisphosphate 2-kinase n=1 Tax=Cimex lectularius TaxID=79782 RepID=A0A8I6TFC7_CIMLE|nr:inositol-pentakisphosphate 2-kinase [Cimex lectularius]XP_014246149.1 inositol-pentakisphosphate 2-kinase [Cimex lectularius]XP_014246150.1 inositol-pentakisphosphate 2-kinase [Cimex lectularius]XP_014246151.1 inositol-pentakisphosphate 2-kinase [Cimex lectularius]XP_014246152.1 inositol-pentakisphosphate 2-kinase [Cimex lectularius]XP_024083887.1 inositol-pentakisphosphate 2-kinase [Cimex lectularius]